MCMYVCLCSLYIKHTHVYVCLWVGMHRGRVGWSYPSKSISYCVWVWVKWCMLEQGKCQEIRSHPAYTGPKTRGTLKQSNNNYARRNETISSCLRGPFVALLKPPPKLAGPFLLWIVDRARRTFTKFRARRGMRLKISCA